MTINRPVSNFRPLQIRFPSHCEPVITLAWQSPSIEESGLDDEGDSYESRHRSLARNDREVVKFQFVSVLTKADNLIMNYYIYILTNEHRNVIYTGVTNDLVRRIYEHRQHMDKNSFTARYNVTRLVYYEDASDPVTAIEREKQIKSWNRKRKNRLVESRNPDWMDLYEEILK